MPDSGGALPVSGDPQPAETATKVIFGKYELGPLLGRGASAMVYLARHLPSGHSVAVKVFPKLRHRNSSAATVSDDDTYTCVIREISALRRLRHPHILRLIEVLASRSKIYLVLELAKGGELFARLAARGRLPEEHSRRLFHQLIAAVAYSHTRGVFHRDLKPENLLLDEAGDIKVSDFGLSALATDRLRSDGLLHTICGTPAFVSPEILSKKAYDGAAADVWSCGVILFVLNAGYLPFNDPNLIAMYRKIIRGQFRCPRWTSPELCSLLSRLLDPNPDTRITVDDILQDPWFAKDFDYEKWMNMMRFGGHNEEAAPPWAKAGGDNDDGCRRQLNAFDLISFSSGLDLSGLIDEAGHREQFVWNGPAERLLDLAEEVGRKYGLVVRRKGKEGLGLVIEGQNGNLNLRVEAYRLTGELAVVEVEKFAGGSGGNFWKEKLRPLLKKEAK